MIGYASRTGTRRNLAALEAHGWRLLVSASGVHRSEGMRYAIDNGAWSAFMQGEEFNADRFRKCCDLLGAGADWIVVPDIVQGGMASLAFSLKWLPEVQAYGAPVLIAVQDGMSSADLRPLLGERVGIFVGGSTEWKLATLPAWGELARECGCWMHVGRVNSETRIARCHIAGAHSFDGTSATRYAVTLPRLDMARRQGYLF